MYRLYLDEVGTDGLTNLDVDRHRFLSLSGVAISLPESRDTLGPSMDRIKASMFDHDPDMPIVFHRKDIVGGKGPFQRIRSDADFSTRFGQSVLRIVGDTDFRIITALIDKAWMLRQYHWRKSHPYHYLMEIMVEKYVQFLERRDDVGDIMPESRQAKDKTLQETYEAVRRSGTDFVDANRIAARLPSRKLKFRTKKDRVSGLEFCDLLAHPSHIYTRSLMRHDVNLGAFSSQVVQILIDQKYDRSHRGRIQGYGIKHLP